MVNPQTPIINTDKFLEHWNKAGRDTTALSPTFEVLALVMQVRLYRQRRELKS